MKSYKERLKIAKNFTKHNQLFSIIAAILMIILIANAIGNKFSNSNQEVPTETNQETVSSEMISDEAEQEEPLKWRFYPIDLVILAVGGGFCGIMIIREKKKEREKLQ